MEEDSLAYKNMGKLSLAWESKVYDGRVELCMVRSSLAREIESGMEK